MSCIKYKQPYAIVLYVYSVRIIGSVPGAHTGLSMYKWGHMKLRKVTTIHYSVLLVYVCVGIKGLQYY